MKLRLSLLAALSILAAAGLVACGGSDDPDGPQQLSFSVSGTRDAGNFKVTGPESVSSGEVEITVTNDTDSETDLQLLRTEGDETIGEAAEALSSASRGGPLPDWILAAGGVGELGAGESGTVTQVLEPGTYFGFSTATNPDAQNGLEIQVEGDQSDVALSARESVEAFDYGFKTEGLTSGSSQLLFRNIGAQPHHLVMAPLKAGKTAADVEKAFRSNSGPPPIEEEGAFSTAVLDTEQEQIIPVDLEPGNWVMLCFISDRQGGPPHIAKGMVQEVEVK